MQAEICWENIHFFKFWKLLFKKSSNILLQTYYYKLCIWKKQQKWYVTALTFFIFKVILFQKRPKMPKYKIFCLHTTVLKHAKYWFSSQNKPLSGLRADSSDFQTSTDRMSKTWLHIWSCCVFLLYVQMDVLRNYWKCH